MTTEVRAYDFANLHAVVVLSACGLGQREQKDRGERRQRANEGRKHLQISLPMGRTLRPIARSGEDSMLLVAMGKMCSSEQLVDQAVHRVEMLALAPCGRWIGSRDDSS